MCNTAAVELRPVTSGSDTGTPCTGAMAASVLPNAGVHSSRFSASADCEWGEGRSNLYRRQYEDRCLPLFWRARVLGVGGLSGACCVGEPASERTAVKTLDAAELLQLTGYRTGQRQARWVRDNLCLEPMVGADGRPRLTWGIVEQAALARRAGSPGTVAGVSLSPQPNWTKGA